MIKYEHNHLGWDELFENNFQRRLQGGLLELRQGCEKRTCIRVKKSGINQF